MAETGKPLEATVFIGDTAWDMRMAGAAGVAGFGVDWGYHPVSDLQAAGARHILSAMRELVPLAEMLLRQGRVPEKMS